MVSAVADDLKKQAVAPVFMTSHGFRQSTEEVHSMLLCAANVCNTLLLGVRQLVSGIQILCHEQHQGYMLLGVSLGVS